MLSPFFLAVLGAIAQASAGRVDTVRLSISLELTEARTPVAAEFGVLTGLALDRAGNLYVAAAWWLGLTRPFAARSIRTGAGAGPRALIVRGASTPADRQQAESRSAHPELLLPIQCGRTAA